MISLSECKKRRVYKIHSRNFSYGVFNGEDGFMGIREKFGNRYLFTEFHWEQGPPFGTVQPDEDLNIDVPEEIELIEYTEPIDKKSKRPVAFDTPVSQGGKGWFFLDTGEASAEIDPMCFVYKPLFDFLNAIEKQEKAKR